MTQCEKILEYMEQKGHITAWDAVYNLGVFRLSARIADLRADGYKIKTEMVKKKDGRGEFKYYASYSLEGDEDEQESI